MKLMKLQVEAIIKTQAVEYMNTFMTFFNLTLCQSLISHLTGGYLWGEVG